MAETRIGGRIQAVRVASGLSKEAVAFALGVSVASVRYWERDKHTPQSASMVDLATLTGCSLEWLLTGAGEMGDVHPIFEVVLPDRRRRLVRAATAEELARS